MKPILVAALLALAAPAWAQNEAPTPQRHHAIHRHHAKPAHHAAPHRPHKCQPSSELAWMKC